MGRGGEGKGGKEGRQGKGPVSRSQASINK